MYTHKRGRETNIIVEIELGQFLGYQKDSKLKFVTISGKNQTKILVPFAQRRAEDFFRCGAARGAREKFSGATPIFLGATPIFQIRCGAKKNRCGAMKNELIFAIKFEATNE